MKKVVISLFLSLALLAAPVVHAAGLECESGSCPTFDTDQKVEKIDKVQSKSKIDKSAHHCCSHASAKLEINTSKLMTNDAAQLVFDFDDIHIASVVVGPPLKPPSHA